MVGRLLFHLSAFWALHSTGPGGTESSPSSPPRPSACVCGAVPAVSGMGGWGDLVAFHIDFQAVLLVQVPPASLLSEVPGTSDSRAHVGLGMCKSIASRLSPLLV